MAIMSKEEQEKKIAFRKSQVNDICVDLKNEVESDVIIDRIKAMDSVYKLSPADVRQVILACTIGKLNVESTESVEKTLNAYMEYADRSLTLESSVKTELLRIQELVNGLNSKLSLLKTVNKTFQAYARTLKLLGYDIKELEESIEIDSIGFLVLETDTLLKKSAEYEGTVKQITA